MEHYGKLLVFGLSLLYVYRQKCICGLNQRPMWVHKSENIASKTHAKKLTHRNAQGIFRIKCNIKQTITGLRDCSTRLVSSMLCRQTPMIRNKQQNAKRSMFFPTSQGSGNLLQSPCTAPNTFRDCIWAWFFLGCKRRSY